MVIAVLVGNSGNGTVLCIIRNTTSTVHRSANLWLPC